MGNWQREHDAMVRSTLRALGDSRFLVVSQSPGDELADRSAADAVAFANYLADDPNAAAIVAVADATNVTPVVSQSPGDGHGARCYVDACLTCGWPIMHTPLANYIEALKVAKIANAEVTRLWKLYNESGKS